jgi:phosphatidylglycerophosphate synthase
MNEQRPVETDHIGKERGLSRFATGLIGELAAGGFRGPAWRRFYARAFERCRQNLAASPSRTLAFALWAAGGAAIGVGLLLLRWLHPQMPTPPTGHAVAWAAWYAITTTWGVLHLGLADAGEAGSHRLGVPNGLSFVRFGLAPIVVAVSPIEPVTAPDPIPATLVAVLVVSDVLDGQLARALGVVSRLGRMLDPLADVVSLTAIAIALFRVEVVPLPLLCLLLFRFPGGFVIALALYLGKGPFRIRPTLLGRITVVLLYAIFLLSFIAHYRLIPWPPEQWVTWALWALCLPLTANIIYLAIHGWRHLRS